MSMKLLLNALIKFTVGFLMLGALLVFAVYPFVIVVRIRNEEAVLKRELAGYTEYQIFFRDDLDQIKNKLAMERAGVVTRFRDMINIDEHDDGILTGDDIHGERIHFRTRIRFSENSRLVNMRHDASVAIIIVSHDLHLSRKDDAEKKRLFPLGKDGFMLAVRNDLCAKTGEHSQKLVVLHTAKQRTFPQNIQIILHIDLFLLKNQQTFFLYYSILYS